AADDTRAELRVAALVLARRGDHVHPGHLHRHAVGLGAGPAREVDQERHEFLEILGERGRRHGQPGRRQRSDGETDCSTTIDHSKPPLVDGPHPSAYAGGLATGRKRKVEAAKEASRAPGSRYDAPRLTAPEEGSDHATAPC